MGVGVSWLLFLFHIDYQAKNPLPDLSPREDFLLYIPGGIRTPDRSLRRRMLYPAELLRHAVFASRIPIYFTAWGGLCQGLSGLGGPLLLSDSYPLF